MEILKFVNFLVSLFIQDTFFIIINQFCYEYFNEEQSKELSIFVAFSENIKIDNSGF